MRARRAARASCAVTLGDRTEKCKAAAGNEVRSLNQVRSFNLLNQYISARAAQNFDGPSLTLCSVPPGRAQREPQGYVGLTKY